MALIEGRSSDSTGKSRNGVFSNLGPKMRNSWLGKNWHTAVLILLMVVLAFFIRSYFFYSPSVDNGYLVSGGSDSYYHERVIGYVEATGQHLFRDPMLNYPFGMRNPRLPLYDWSVAVTSMFSSAVTGASITDTTGFVLVVSTAFWGAITVIPVYMIGRTMFGRKAGLAAALLFALMPGNIERSVLSDADHDAFVLFFMVVGFFFLLMALKSIKGDRWVSNWKDFKSVRQGIGSYFRMNQLSTIYAMLGGVSITAVAFTWEGYPYVLIIILVFFLFQVLVNRFKNFDSMGVFMVIAVMLGLFFILSAPLYAQLLFWQQWFDIPLYLFLAVMVVGAFFVVTRDYPWTLVIPIFVAMVVVGMVALALFAPSIFEAIITGQGYLVKSKLYTTISEAQAPDFSTLVLSFGAVSFWLAIAGLVWAAIKIPKNLSPYFIFIVVWTAAAMFMAMAQARFMFNASPAFAILGGWVLVAIIEMVKFEDLPRGIQGTAPWKHAKTWFKGVFKVKYVMAAFFIVVLILLPNVWTAVDAGIPAEEKKQYDLQIYDAMPSFLRPTSYSTTNSTLWYLGAFSSSLPMPNTYFPAAWSWFSQRDSNITPAVNKPAFLSWWDYGFEAVQEGEHPTVADNFQNAYQFAGCYITCTDEAQAVAMLCARILEKTGVENATYKALLISYGVNYDQLKDQMENPGNWVQYILAHPEIYGPFDTDLGSINAMWISSRVTISAIGLDNTSNLYHDLRALSGYDIGYFAIDSRLFPFSATGYNIFYAPAKLSDHVMDPYTNAPVEFYKIKAVLSTGEEVDVQNVTSKDTVVSYAIIYEPAFYETMLYRAFMGYGPYDIGLTSQGIPGFSGSLTYYPSAQAWNQTHFRAVYRTAYYNPFPEKDVANHTDAWRAISYDEAIELQAEIDAGTAIGVVDMSTSTLAQGVVFVQYYDGVEISGKVTTSSGLAYPNVYVTALDEYGTPHDTVQTDADGNYKVIAPFGNVSIVYSIGTLDKRTQIATDTLLTKKIHITYKQAMREVGDDNHDGKPDWQLNGDVTVPAYNLTGKVYWDTDSSGSYDSNDVIISNATVVAKETKSGFEADTVSTSDGYTIEGLPAMNYTVYAIVDGHQTDSSTASITTTKNTTLDIGIKPASINGTVSYTDGSAATGFSVVLTDLTNGTSMVQSTDDSGKFSFGDLIYGNYTLQSGVAGITFGQANFAVTNGQRVVTTVTAYNAMTLHGQATLSNGQVAANATITLTSDRGTQTATADATGRYSLVLPAGTYNVEFMVIRDGTYYMSLKAVSSAGGTVSLSPTLSPGNYVNGVLVASGNMSGVEVTFQSRTSGATVVAVANATGCFNMLLPTDEYFVYATLGSYVYWNNVYVSKSGQLSLSMVNAAFISGTVWYDSNHDSVQSSGEGVSGVPVTVHDLDGRSWTVTSGSTGYYYIALAPNINYYLSVDQDGYEPIEKSYTPLVTSVTTNLQLVPLNRTVQGTVSLSGAPMAGITVSLVAVSGSGGVSANATSGTGGQFALSLVPGEYSIVVDQDVVAGDNSSRYQYNAELTVQIGKDPSALAVGIVQRYLVTGLVSPDRSTSARVNFTGPETKVVTAQTNFTTYLMAGTYSVYTYVERLGLRYADLFEQDIGLGSTVSITTTQAYSLQGTLKTNGTTFQGNAPVNITRANGGTVHLTSTVIGAFSTYLPAGNYTANVDFRTVQTVSTKERYLRYVGSTSFTLTTASSISVYLEKSYDNATLTGTVYSQGAPVSATLMFIPASGTALFGNVTATQSGYSAELAPGNYSIYVKQISGPAVFMGTATVEPYVTNHLNVTLVPGLLLTGNTLLNGVAGPALIEFSSENYMFTNSGPDGYYSIYLPADEYVVRATAQGTERGVAVDYSTELTLDLQTSQNKVIDLAKVAEYSVAVQWDQSEKLTVSPGQTVTYTVKIVNQGNVADTYALTTTAPSGWTVTLSQSTVSVDFGSGSNTQQVAVQIATPTTAKVDHTAVTVRATSQKGSSTDLVDLDVGISPVYSVKMSLSSVLSTTGSSYIYNMAVKNTGNIDDTYNISVSNLAELASQGWKVEVRTTDGTFGEYLSLTVGAGASSNFELRLTPTRQSPEPAVTVVLIARSVASADSYSVLNFSPQLPNFTIPSGGFSVTGTGVSTSLPTMPWLTVALIGLVIAMATITVLVSLQKGVFKRRKR